MSVAPSLAMEPRDSLFRKMIILSAAVHAVTFALGVVWMALRVPAVRVSPVAVVDLIGGGEWNPPAPVPEAKPAAPAEAPREKPAPTRPAAAPRKAAKRGMASAPAAPKRQFSPKDAREVSDEIRRMREKRATSAKVREAVQSIQREKEIRAAVRGIGERVAHRVDLSGVRARAKAKPSERRSSATGMPGSAGTARVSPEILAYARALDEKVRANWTVPELDRKDMGKLMVQMRILIEKDGRVSSIRMEKLSGNSYFDDSVRRAILKASPLPIPPAQLRGGEEVYEVGFRFYGGEEP